MSTKYGDLKRDLAKYMQQGFQTGDFYDVYKTMREMEQHIWKTPRKDDQQS